MAVRQTMSGLFRLFLLLLTIALISFVFYPLVREQPSSRAVLPALWTVFSFATVLSRLATLVSCVLL